MRIGMIGLGKMGANMVRRLRSGGIEVVGYNRSPEIINQLHQEADMIPASDIGEVLSQLATPRIIWLMLPSGSPTEEMLKRLQPALDAGDIVIDGGNANYLDSQRRGHWLNEHDIGFIDAGTSGGIWGRENGYCMMVGGEEKYVDKIIPALKVLAPTQNDGWAHVGPIGAGHFTKMIHNGIEYGMMQAYAEGFALLQGKDDFKLDLANIAELWRHGSVVQSWLLDLTADFLQTDQNLKSIEPFVADSGEGRWTIEESIRQGTATPVLAQALYARFTSQDNDAYGNRLLAMMRNAFGGHAVKSEKP